MLLAALAGVATAALVGVALAKTFTLHAAANGKVINQTGMITSENIVVNGRGFAVYDLTGDSKRHPECTKASGCFRFWPPVTVSSPAKLSEGSGVKGRLGVWRRDGFFQVTLGGRPVYGFAPDNQAHVATGEGVKSFGGTWHVIKAAGSPIGTTTMATTTSTSSTTTTTATTTSTSSTTSSTTTTMTMPCLYPPCY
jgi:predicted lipoprotein with Yx(FWY)xxD motif